MTDKINPIAFPGPEADRRRIFEGWAVQYFRELFNYPTAKSSTAPDAYLQARVQDAWEAFKFCDQALGLEVQQLCKMVEELRKHVLEFCAPSIVVDPSQMEGVEILHSRHSPEDLNACAGQDRTPEDAG